MRLALAALFAAFSSFAAVAQTVAAEDAFPGLTFSQPVDLDVAPGQAERAYVVEQAGRVLTAPPGASTAETFLDIRPRVQSGGEAGLLGLAFHPGYAANGRLFVHYTAPVERPRRGERVFVSRVSEFARAAGDPLRADAASERVLLEVDQPEDNHNAGALAFGPDGLLYIALGDGGGGGDPFQSGQDPTTLLGAILRIDVDDVPAGAPYGIPDTNPFALTDGPERDEIYAYGFRNPYKISVDADGTVWAGDVGQDRWEEIDRVEAGGNYGWNRVEGPECFRDPCDLSAFDAPVFSYFHSDGNVSITGGVGTAGTPLAVFGDYVYGDFNSGRIWVLDTSATPATTTLVLESGAFISSIDRGPGDDVLVSTYDVRGGRSQVYRLAVQGGTDTTPPAASGAALRLAGPSPFRSGTAVEVEARPGAPLQVSVVDALGREVADLWNGPAPSGSLRLEIGGAGLAPGVYTVRLRSGAGRADVRVVRVR